MAEAEKEKADQQRQIADAEAQDARETLAIQAHLKLEESDFDAAEKLGKESLKNFGDVVEDCSLEELPRFVLAEVSRQRHQEEQSKSMLELSTSPRILPANSATKA